MKRPITLLLISGLLFSCITTKNKIHKEDKDLDKIVSLLSGTFSSEQQSKEDTSYFHIRLVMVPIWTDKEDGQWMYVEQAMSTALEKPYRQRVYHLKHPAEYVFTSDIYTIKDPLTYAGLQNDKNKMKALTFDKIELKDGCRVTLNLKDDIYEGGTEADHCPSDLRGAKYATTKIRLKEGELVSWDQGFDSTGNQVWGAVKGGYVFIKE